MKSDTIFSGLDSLKKEIEGDLKYDNVTRIIY